MLSKQAKIMIVDDMKMIRTAIKKYLAELGYENTVEAKNGKQAIEKFAAESPDFIFMDIVMPETTGKEALHEIRKANSKTPIVMLTSVADEKTIDQCVEEGILGYLLKPINADNGPEILIEYLAKV